MQRSGGAVERRPDVVARRVVAAATGASRKGNPQRHTARRSWHPDAYYPDGVP